MREHGTHACYVWGPEPGSNPGAGCRCHDCRRAHTAYEVERSHRVAPAYVGADTARQHVRFLAEHGLGLKTLAKRSGVAHGALWKLIYGVPSIGRAPSKRIRRETQDKILAVQPADRADGARVPAAPTWDIVDRLLERGWTKAAISEAIGQNGRALQLSRHTITARNARAIAALLDQPVPPRRSRFGLHEVEQPDVDDEPRPLVDDLPKPPSIDLTAEAWRFEAACRMPDVPPWLFFPGRGDIPTTEAALAVCARCAVRDQCLEVHLDEKDGIWGGTTGRQRRDLRKARGIPDDDQADDESEAA